MGLSLPSLGATTSVPGAAGAATVAGPASGNFIDSDGVWHITVQGDGSSKPRAVENPFGDTMQRLFGITPDQMFTPTQTDNPTSPDASGGSEIIDGPVSIPGSLDDLWKWLQENGPLLIVVGIVLLLSFYGLSAATRR